jgi:uncharacterized membrane protein YeiH
MEYFTIIKTIYSVTIACHSRGRVYNDIPVIFRKEIYATICIIGGIVFFALKKLNLDNDVLYLITSLVIIIIRLLAVKFKWYLPALEKE